MASFAARSEPGVGSAAGEDFTMQDLQHLLHAEFGPAAAKKLQWAMSPIEYLARRPSGKQLLVNSVPVSSLLGQIASMLESCMQLVGTGTAAQAQSVARKTVKLITHLLMVLKARRIQERLGGLQQLQPLINLLEGALQQFSRYAVQQPCSCADAHATARSAGAEPHAGAIPAAASQRSGDRAAAAAAGSGATVVLCGSNLARRTEAVAALASVHSSVNDSGGKAKGLDLAALLAALAPFAGRPSTPIPQDFPQLLATWAQLVYGELAGHGSIPVSALLLYHPRTLLRYLQQRVGCVAASADTAVTSHGPMTAEAAVRHVDALLHLLQHDTLRELFTRDLYDKVNSRYAAIRAVLAGKQPTAAMQESLPVVDPSDAAAKQEQGSQLRGAGAGPPYTAAGAVSLLQTAAALPAGLAGPVLGPEVSARSGMSSAQQQQQQQQWGCSPSRVLRRTLGRSAQPRGVAGYIRK